MLYTIGPPDIIGRRYSFGIIRGICNQRGVHFAYTSQRSTYVQALLLVRKLNTVHESVSSSFSFWYAAHQRKLVSTHRRMYEFIVAELPECAQNVYISLYVISSCIPPRLCCTYFVAHLRFPMS